MVMIINVVMLVMVIMVIRTDKKTRTNRTERGQIDLTFKLDFPGYLCRAASAILATFCV